MSTSLIFIHNPEAREAFDGSFWMVQEAFLPADPPDGGNPIRGTVFPVTETG